jgi:hypothetical protein
VIRLFELFDVLRFASLQNQSNFYDVTRCVYVQAESWVMENTITINTKYNVVIYCLISLCSFLSLYLAFCFKTIPITIPKTKFISE